jgi:mitochondrial fission protein ELM1
LLGARAGDNNQVIALAETIGLPFEIKQLEYNALRHLGPRLLGASLASLTEASRRNIADQPLPDLTISSGHRGVAVVQALRRRSRGRVRSIHLGFPRVSPGKFDLVITTPQYPVQDHPNVLRLPYALTRAAIAESSQDVPATLPSPRRLLLVGGPNPFWKLDEAKLTAALSTMLGEAANAGGSVLVSTSPRTPSNVHAHLAASLARSSVPHVLAAPGRPPSYAALLKGADSIRVTADSVAMVSDAIWTGKPVALVPVGKSALGRLVMAFTDAIRPGRPHYPQDLRYFWKALKEIGMSDHLALPRDSTAETMRTILNRVRPIVDQIA